MNLDTIWSNILKHEGEKFYTIRGIEFIYTSKNGDKIIPSNIDGSKLSPITKDTIGKVIAEYMPLKNTAEIGRVFRAPSYIYAILTDNRIV